MKPLWSHPATLTWLVLMSATGLSWWLGYGHDASNTGPRAAATAGMIVIAFGKVWLVMYQFMEVRNAPWPLRLVCMGWVTLTAIALLVLFGTAG
jgi:hypothetical protein